MKSPRNRGLALLLTAVWVLALSAGALGSSVTLVSGSTHEARLVGFFTLEGVDHLVFRMSDGSIMTYPISEIASIQISSGTTQSGGSAVGQPSQPYSGAQPPAVTPPAPPQSQYSSVEREPNNDAATATPIAFGTDIAGVMSVADDRDMYKLTVSSHGTFHITCTQPVDFYLSLMDSTGTRQLYGGDFGGVNTNMVLDADVFEPGTYYVLVRRYSGSQVSDLPYTLRVNFREARDPFEPNDTIQTASPVASGVQFDGFIYRPGDVDYYRVDVSGPATINVAATQPADYYLSVVDSTGTKQLCGGDLGGMNTDMSLDVDVFEPGAYYVMIRGYRQEDYNMHDPYKMKITVKPGLQDASEPNDSASQAKGLRLGQAVTGVISSEADQDWWSFDAPLLGNVRITCTQPADFMLRIVDSSGKDVIKQDLGGKGTLMELTYQLIPFMRYYVVVQPYSSGNYNMHEAYQLTVSPAK